jgi:hypothetical protein
MSKNPKSIQITKGWIIFFKDQPKRRPEFVLGTMGEGSLRAQLGLNNPGASVTRLKINGPKKRAVLPLLTETPKPGDGSGSLP